jgi:hypothetical protein
VSSVPAPSESATKYPPNLRDARAHSWNMLAAHIRHFLNSGCSGALALPGKRPRPSARSALFMIAVKTRAYGPHFYHEKNSFHDHGGGGETVWGQALIWVIRAQEVRLLWPSLQARNRRSRTSGAPSLVALSDQSGWPGCGGGGTPAPPPPGTFPVLQASLWSSRASSRLIGAVVAI